MINKKQPTIPRIMIYPVSPADMDKLEICNEKLKSSCQTCDIRDLYLRENYCQEGICPKELYVSEK